MNKVILIGRITKDLEIKNAGNSLVLSFNLAVKRPMTKDKTDFIPISVWNQSAEYLNEFANKGSLISVIGRYEVYETDNDGQKRSYHKVTAENVSILENKKQEESKTTGQEYTVPTPKPVKEETNTKVSMTNVPWDLDL